MRLRDVWGLLVTAAKRWFHSDPSQLSASLAFKVVMSTAPLLLLLLAVVGSIVGAEAARERLLGAIESMFGPAALPVARTLLDTMGVGRVAGLVGTALGLLVMAHFASSIFGELRFALNRIWGVTPALSLGGAVRGWIGAHLMVPFAVLATLALILVNLIGATVGSITTDLLPTGTPLAAALTGLVSFFALAALIATVFRYVPSMPIAWSDVRLGAVLTAALLQLGNHIIGQWMGRSLLVSLYGTAGAIVVVLLWAYYAAHIFLFGAHFARAYAERFGTLREQPEATD